MSDKGRSFHHPDAGDQTVVERIDPRVGSVIDKRYRVEFRLAAGGFGAIYKATHIKSGHVVALKVLHREMASDPRVVARFRREGDALTSLRDPHTITAYEIGEDASGALFIVMELLHGESLYERFRGRGPLPWKQVAAIGHAICSSLAEAHARGIVHRDLKPANIHLEPRAGEPDYVKVLDFGIAKIINGGGGDNADLTNAGQMIGTFDYMSPEQMVGECTTRSDIYTLGVLMYEMICGVRPFDDVAGPTSLLAALITRTPPRLSSRANVPADLDDIVMRCLEKEPSARYPDVLALQRDLHRVLLPSLLPEDEATRAIQIPTGGSKALQKVSAPIMGDEPTWLGNLNAPVMLTPGSGYTPMPRSGDDTPTPGLTPTPAAERTPTPTFQGPPPPQPPVVFPPARSVPPRRPASPTPPPLLPHMFAPDRASLPSLAALDRGSAPVMYPAGAYIAPPRSPTGPPWVAAPDPGVPRPGAAEVRSFDMAAATSRDAWVGRILWIVLLAIAIAITLFLVKR